MRRSKGEGTVFQTTNNGEQVWCAAMTIELPDGSKKKIRGFGTTRSQAIERRQRNLQKRLSAPQPTEKTPTVFQVLERWIEAQKGNLGPESARKYRNDITNHIIPDFGNRPIGDITSEELEKHFWGNLAERGTGYSAIWNAFGTTRTMFNWAKKHQIIDRNPLEAVRTPKKEVKVSEDDNRWINKRIGIATGMIKWLDQEQNPLKEEHYCRILMMFLGLRRAELLGLTWDCVNNLEKRGKASIVVQQQLKRYEKDEPQTGWYIDTKTKNRKTRVIHLPEKWRNTLREHKKQTASIESPEEWQQNLIFKNPRTGTHLSYNRYEQGWKKVLEDYVNNKRPQPKPLDETEYFRPHAARHIAASVFLAEGVSLETVQDILGHLDQAQTLHYAHITRQARTEAANLYGEKFSK